MRDDHRLDIRPGVGVLGVFPHVNYKPWFALGEFVDNAIQSYLSSLSQLRSVEGPGYRLKIEIELDTDDEGLLVVRDNAAGIASDRFADAFIAAEPPPDAGGLSQFGMGLKSAACWFAASWQVRTKALGEPVERTVAFDIPKITREKIESLHWTERAAAPQKHYTELRLWDLHRAPVGRTVGKLKDHLESIYRIFLRKGDVEIFFRGAPLKYEEPEVLSAPRAVGGGPAVEWRKKIDIRLDRRHSARGFAALRRTGSTSKAGFAVFRRNRLILGSDEDGWRPPAVFGASNTFRYQRLFGELHVTGFDVVYTKDAFLFGELEEQLVDALASVLDTEPLPLLRQAEQYRSRVDSLPAPRAAEQVAASTAEAIDLAQGQIGAQVEADPSDAPLAARAPDVTSLASKTVDLHVAGQRWSVTIDLTSDPGVGDWYSIFDLEPPRRAADPRTLTIRIGLGHPFTTQFGGTSASSLEPLVRLATGFALAEITARAEGVDRAGTLRRNLNDLLRGPLAAPSAFLETQ